jgi:hypothetical protein
VSVSIWVMASTFMDLRIPYTWGWASAELRMAKSTLTSKGQVIVPKHLRKDLKLLKGIFKRSGIKRTTVKQMNEAIADGYSSGEGDRGGF